MSKMLRTHQNTIGNLVIALLFVGGCIFLLTGSWDASVSEAAKGCCGGGTTLTDASTLANTQYCPTGWRGCAFPNTCAECVPKGDSTYCSGNNCCTSADTD